MWWFCSALHSLSSHPANPISVPMIDNLSKVFHISSTFLSHLGPDGHVAEAAFNQSVRSSWFAIHELCICTHCLGQQLPFDKHRVLWRQATSLISPANAKRKWLLGTQNSKLALALPFPCLKRSRQPCCFNSKPYRSKSYFHVEITSLWWQYR